MSGCFPVYLVDEEVWFDPVVRIVWVCVGVGVGVAVTFCVIVGETVAAVVGVIVVGTVVTFTRVFAGATVCVIVGEVVVIVAGVTGGVCKVVGTAVSLPGVELTVTCS
jgi:hypothetical protein